jgi:transcription elongation factor
VAVGSVEAATDSAKTVILMGSSADLSKNVVEGNYYIENDGTTYYTYTATEANAANIVEFAARPANSVTVATAAQLASGEVAYNLNKAIGKTVFYQTIGTDKVPTTDSASKVVLLVNGAYTNTAPVAPSPAPTGDSAVAIVLALIAVSCGAVLTMKKKVR